MLVLSDEKYELNDYGYIFTRWELTGNTAEHQHLFYELIYTFSGTMVHAVNGTRQYLEPNSLLLIRPNDVHSIGSINTRPYKYYNIMISLQEMDALFQFFGTAMKESLLSSDLPPVITLSHEKGQSFLQSLDTFTTNVYPNEMFKNSNRLFLSHVLYLFFVSDNFKSKSVSPQWFNDMLIKMQQKENFAEGLSALQRLSNRNQAYLRSAFKRYMNCTPITYINSIRLNYGEYILRTTDLPIVEIIFDCGFNNTSHFNHLFKERFGYSPSVYRKISRNSNIDREKQNMHGTHYGIQTATQKNNSYSED